LPHSRVLPFGLAVKGLDLGTVGVKRKINCDGGPQMLTLPNPPDSLKLIHGAIQLVLIGGFVPLVSHKNLNALAIYPRRLAGVDH